MCDHVSEAASRAGHPREDGEREDSLDIEPGAQVLAATRPMDSALARLPPESLENLLVVSIGRDPADIERSVLRRQGQPKKVGVVPVSATPVESDVGLWTAPRISPGDLTGISIGIARGLEHVRPGGAVLVDDLSVLLMYADESRVYRLLMELAARCRSKGARGVYAFSRDAVDGDTYERFRSLVDVEADLR